MKKMFRFLSAALAALTLVTVLGVLPAKVSAAGGDTLNVTISNVASSGKIKLTWNAVEGASAYMIYRSTSKTGPFYLTKTATSTQFANTSTVAGQTYYYIVRAVGPRETYITDSAIVGRTCDLPRPELSIGNKASSGAPNVSWKAIDGAVSYRIYRSTSENGSYSLVKTDTSTVFTDTSAKAGVAYYYKVQAIAEKTAANSAYSEAEGRVCDLPRPMVTVGNVASSGAIKVTWDAIEGAVSYKVYRSTEKDGTYSLLKTATSTSLTNTSAKVGEIYYYKVQAIAENTAANSAYSEPKSGICALPRPVVKVGNVVSSGAPKLSWSAIDGAVGYKVYRSTSESGPYTTMKTVTSTSYTNTGAKPGVTYYYKVNAIFENPYASSAYSAVKSCTRDLAQPKLTVTLNSSGKPRLTWEAVTGATQYKVYRSTSQSSGYSLLYTTSGTSCTNTKVDSGVTYYYKVRALCDNADAASAYSAVQSVRIHAASDLRYVRRTSIFIYEEPTSDSSYLKIPYMTELVLGKAVTNHSSGQWYEVYYQGDLYYLWITPDSDKLTTVRSTLNYTGNTVYQQEVIDLAVTILQEWETHYVHGESGIVHEDGTVGFDCSGFAGYVLNTVMQRYVPAYRLSPATTYLYETVDIYNTGYRGEFKAIDVALEDVQPGDVIFFGSESTGELNHCALYMGNGEFIQSTSTWDGVCLMPLAESYADRFLGIKRFPPETVEAANEINYINYGCRLYPDRRGEEEPLMRLYTGDEVTVLFTKPDGTAYVRTEDGTCGFVWTKFLSKPE